jgi:hypothetical protein
VFGLLSTGSTPACLASSYALCTPKFSITIDQTCLLTFQSMPLVSPKEQDCSTYPSSISFGIKGRRPNLKADLAL